jgi:archaellum component FlaC
MTTNDVDNGHNYTPQEPNSHAGKFTVMAVALAVALGGNGYLWERSNHLNDQIAQIRRGTEAQLSKLNDTAAAIQSENRQQIASLNEALSNSSDATTAAVKRARLEAKRQEEKIAQQLQEANTQFSDQISQLKTATDSQLNAVSTDVSGVKTDVNGVKANVASAQSQLEQHAKDLKRVMGDMGVMSGLIATNSKDLVALRALGERNYTEFTITKGKTATKVGNLSVRLKKADPKHNRYTLEVLADDKMVEKKDRTINEPVQIYVGASHQPDEIVVNQVKKDQIAGYVSTPKVEVAQR